MNLLKRFGMERSGIAPLWAVALNVLLLYVVYSLLRVEYLLENLSYFKSTIADGRIFELLMAGPVFDTPGIFYTNSLYILLMLLPLHWKERRGWYAMCRWVFVVVNGIAIVANLIDSVYFSYTLRRTTWDIFSEFSHDGNLGKIGAVELLRHWYLLIFFAALIWGMWKLYVTPDPGANTRPRWRYYLLAVASLAAAALTTVSGIRGGMLNHWCNYVIAFPLAYAAWRLLSSASRKSGDDDVERDDKSRRRRAISGWCFAASALALVATAPIGGWRHRDIRPIALSNASKYVERPIETALILNTPFTLIRTIGTSAYQRPSYFESEEELAAIYSPEHFPAHTGEAADSLSAIGKGKNVVVIILESFGREYIGSLNRDILGEDYKGYAPFMDSLVSVSATWHVSLDNGRKSIDAMPSILAGIPQFVRSFVLTPAAMNKIEGLPAILRKQGYETAFFHGARTGSMGFDGFARSVGFSHYFGREDFEKDGRAGGSEEFDGYWAIWDEPFMQYYAIKMSDLKPPFMTALFSASSHHPFQLPEKYRNVYTVQGLSIYKTIRYTDNALRRFFETARRQPWYENTIFIITNDHTNQRAYDEYRSDIGSFYGPIIIFDPSGKVAAGEREGIAQQTDIMPTVLNLLGNREPYVAFGVDLLSTAAEQTWAVSYINDIYQYVRYGYVLQFDGTKSIGLYRLGDHKMASNLIGENPSLEQTLERELKAIIQQYMNRMLDDRLTISSGK